MEKQIEVYRLKVESIEGVETQNVANGIILINGLIEQLNQVNKIALTIPKTQETLEKLEERLKKESAGSNMVRGGGDKGNRADPK